MLVLDLIQLVTQVEGNDHGDEEVNQLPKVSVQQTRKLLDTLRAALGEALGERRKARDVGRESDRAKAFARRGCDGRRIND